MKTLRRILFLLILNSFSNTLILAQNAVSTTGGEATGNNGTVSYTIGQIANTVHSGTNGSIIQGVQQPYEISVVTEIEDINATNLQLIIFPNPTRGVVKLIFESFDNHEMRYHLYDNNAILLQNNKIESRETEISMENLPISMYFMKVIINNKVVKVFKIIKN